MRADAREQLYNAAAFELAANDTHVVLVSDEIASSLRVWSDPVQVMLVPTDHKGVLEMLVRREGSDS